MGGAFYSAYVSIFIFYSNLLDSVVGMVCKVHLPSEFHQAFSSFLGILSGVIRSFLGNSFSFSMKLQPVK